MKNNYSNIFAFNKKSLSKTLKYLNNGNIAGLPTETVYGLAGNAYSRNAVQKIFSLKKRSKKIFLILTVSFYPLRIKMNLIMRRILGICL